MAAINTIMSVMGINLKTLRPEPCVEGLAVYFLHHSLHHICCPVKFYMPNFVIRYSTPGGYSCKAVHPIALGKVMSIAKMMKSEFGEGYSLSGIGGVETGADAAEFILLGANTVQVGSEIDSLFSPINQSIWYLRILFLKMGCRTYSCWEILVPNWVLKMP